MPKTEKGIEPYNHNTSKKMKLITLNEQETELLSGGWSMTSRKNKGIGRPQIVTPKPQSGHSNGSDPAKLIPSISSSPITVGWKSLQFVAVNGGTNIDGDFEPDEFNFFS
jgi:hypothetical protein